MNRAPGLSLATAALHTQLQALASAYPECTVSLACLVWRLVSACKKRSAYGQRHENQRLLAGAYARLQSLLGPKTDTLLDTVKGLLDKRYRASSAIEGFNAALRPYLYVHKGVTQNFLELFRAHYNLRTRRWGPQQRNLCSRVLDGDTRQRLALAPRLSAVGHDPLKPQAPRLFSNSIPRLEPLGSGQWFLLQM